MPTFGGLVSDSDSDTDESNGYSSAEEFENGHGTHAGRRGAAERDFDAMEDDPDELDMEFTPEELLRVTITSNPRSLVF